MMDPDNVSKTPSHDFTPAAARRDICDRPCGLDDHGQELLAERGQKDRVWRNHPAKHRKLCVGIYGNDAAFPSRAGVRWGWKSAALSWWPQGSMIGYTGEARPFSRICVAGRRLVIRPETEMAAGWPSVTAVPSQGQLPHFFTEGQSHDFDSSAGQRPKRQAGYRDILAFLPCMVMMFMCMKHGSRRADPDRAAVARVEVPPSRAANVTRFAILAIVKTAKSFRQKAGQQHSQLAPCQAE